MTGSVTLSANAPSKMILSNGQLRLIRISPRAGISGPVTVTFSSGSGVVGPAQQIAIAPGDTLFLQAEFADVGNAIGTVDFEI